MRCMLHYVRWWKQSHLPCQTVVSSQCGGLWSSVVVHGPATDAGREHDRLLLPLCTGGESGISVNDWPLPFNSVVLCFSHWHINFVKEIQGGQLKQQILLKFLPVELVLSHLSVTDIILHKYIIFRLLLNILLTRYHRWVNDLWSPAGWLPVHRDQLRAQRSVSSMGSLYLYLFTTWSTVDYASVTSHNQL